MKPGRLGLVAFTALFALAGTAQAVTVKGFVRRTDGTPVGLADLDVFDAVTGASVFVLNDKTGTDGFYQIVLPAGTYDITYTAPPTLRLAGFRHGDVVVSGTLVTMPDVFLEPGLVVSGHVQDTSSPPLAAPNVEVRFFDSATGLSVFVAANDTDAQGDLSVLVPARTYNLVFAPAAGDTLLPVRIPGVVVTAEVSLPTVSLGRGFLIDGDVVDPLGTPVASVDLDVFDAFTGEQVLTVRDDTDSLGHYSVAVPAGTFDLSFFPPAGAPLAANQLRDVPIAGGSSLPTVTLPGAVTLSGRVVDHLGQPVADVDLDLVDVDRGRIYPTARDNTDAAGDYSVNVPPGLYDVHYGPPVGSGSAAAVREQLSLSGSMPLADTVLPVGRVVTGRLLDAGGTGGPSPVAGAGFVVFDDATGMGYPDVASPSALDGTFSLVLPPGSWVIEPLPPRGLPLVTRKLGAIDLTLSDGSLGDVSLARGVALSGRVLGQSGGIRDVDLDVIDAAGTRLVTPRDNTDPLGNYQVFVPEGTYTVEYEPPRETDLAALRVSGIAVAGATTLPDVVLERGVVVTGRVLGGPLAEPAYNVDLNVKDALGTSYLTPHDNTWSDGTFKVVLPAAGDPTARIDFVPPRGSRLLFASLAPLDLSADQTLGDVTLTAGLLVSGQVTRPAGTGVRGVDLTVFDSNSGLSILTPHDRTDGAGQYVVSVPAGLYNLQYVPPPPATGGEKLVPGRLAAVDVAADLSSVDVGLEAGVWVEGRVTTTIGSGVAGADLDFVLPDGTIAFTPRDNTAVDGSFSLVVAPSTYTLAVDPPAGSRLMGARRSDVVLLADDRNVPPFILYGGYFVEGYLEGTDGSPIDGADLDVIDPLTGVRLYTPGDNTDAAGFYHVVVPPGVWDIHYDPPAGSNLPSVRRLAVAVSGDTMLPVTVVPDGFRVEGFVFDSGTTPVPGSLVDFLLAGTRYPAVGNTADAAGRFRTFVPAGTYDVVFSPPPGTGLAPLVRPAVVIAGDSTLVDAHLSPSVQPSWAGVTPASGSAAGGLTVVLGGTNFTSGSQVYFGNVEATVLSSSSDSITVVTPSHPPGVVDVSVANPGSEPAVGPRAFTFQRRNPDISCVVSRSGDDLILSWSDTGQAAYTVFRSSTADPASAVAVGSTTMTGLTVPGGAHESRENVFYEVE